MRNSLIFMKSSATVKKYAYVAYDCCEGLGSQLRSRHGDIMYVAVPIKELDPFFLENNFANLRAYLQLITESFDITYSIATPEELVPVDIKGCSYCDGLEIVVIKIDVGKHSPSNKYFNVAYNAMRYIWYNQYTNMAIIATNLYSMHVIDDPMDILAIAFSYQKHTDRAILPATTDSLEGILFFRSKQEVIPELQKDVPFNTVFFKYAVYFNPVVHIRGSFFDDATSTIDAKSVFGRLEGLMDINDMPKIMIHNIKLIYKDYLSMKPYYIEIKNFLDKERLIVARDRAVLLQKGVESVEFTAADPMGNSKKVKIQLCNVIPKIKKDIEEVATELLF